MKEILLFFVLGFASCLSFMYIYEYIKHHLFTWKQFKYFVARNALRSYIRNDETDKPWKQEIKKSGYIVVYNDRQTYVISKLFGLPLYSLYPVKYPQGETKITTKMYYIGNYYYSEHSNLTPEVLFKKHIIAGYKPNCKGYIIIDKLKENIEND